MAAETGVAELATNPAAVRATRPRQLLIKGVKATLVSPLSPNVKRSSAAEVSHSGLPPAASQENAPREVVAAHSSSSSARQLAGSARTSDAVDQAGTSCTVSPVGDK